MSKTCSKCGVEIADNQIMCDDCFEDSNKTPSK